MKQLLQGRARRAKRDVQDEHCDGEAEHAVAESFHPVLAEDPASVRGVWVSWHGTVSFASALAGGGKHAGHWRALTGPSPGGSVVVNNRGRCRLGRTATSLLQTPVAKPPSGARKTRPGNGSDEDDSTRRSCSAVQPGPGRRRPPMAVDPTTAGFRALAYQVRTTGLLDRRPGYYSLKITLTILTFLAAWVLFVIVGNSWTTLAVAVLAGFIFTQLGFLGHDAGHNQVFGARRHNRLLGLAVGNVLIGLSFGWWVHKHNAHHAHPNEVGRDPDIGAESPCPRWTRRERARPLESWMARWQAPLFFPLMLLRSGGMHVLGVKRLLRERDRAAALEGSLIALHVALYLTVVLCALPAQGAGVHRRTAGGLLGVPGLQLRPQPQGDAAHRDAQRRRASSAARSSPPATSAGGRFTDFMLGGLNYQIEHHLFP